MAGLLLSLAWAAPGHAAGNTPIFILHSYSQEYPWTKRQHEGFLRKLGAAVPDTIAASVEYLDTKRVPYTAAYADFTATHIAKKYAGFAPKLIYVTDDNALLFALTHLTRIFPKAPIFFSGINDFGVKQRIDPRRVTGVFEEKEIAPNLDLMRHLAPGVRDILVVGDESETFQAIRREIVAELAHQPNIKAQYLSSGRIEILVAALKGRKEQFVFLTTLGAMSDAAGNTLTLPETIAAIVQAGWFTIISMEDVYLYPGVLGGYVTSGHKQGAAAAELSARYLTGTAVAAIKPIESSPNEYIIDGSELEKLGLTLPPGLAGRATILNPSPTFYERNLKLIVQSLYVFALLFVASLVAFIYALMRKNRQIARTSQDLAAQTERLRTVIESFPVVLWAIDGEGVFTLSRGAGLKVLGLAPDEVVGKSLFEIYRDLPEIIASVRRALAGESHVAVSSVGALAFETHYAPLRDARGSVIGATGVSTDVTERKRTEAALQESEGRYRTMIEWSPEAIIVHRGGKLLYVNSAATRMFGARSEQDLIGKPILDLIHPDFHHIALARVRSITDGGVNAPAVEEKYLKLDGTVIDVEIQGAPILYDGEPAVHASIRDITERKRAEQAIQESEVQLKSVLGSTLDGILAVDRDGKVIQMNQRFAQLWRIPQSLLDSKDDKTLLDYVVGELADPEAFLKRVQALYQSDLEATDTIEFKDGRVFERFTSPLILNRSVIGRVWSFRDITERKQAEAKLQLSASVFTHALEGILITDAEGNIIEVNDAFRHITGYGRDEVLGRNPRLLQSGRQEKAVYAAMWRDLIEKGHWLGELWNRRKTGEVYAEKLTISAVRDEQGATQQYVALFSDITSLKEHEKQLEHIAHYDALTALPNRVLLADRLQQAIAQVQRRGQSLAVAYLDLDGFKAINDDHGHGAGDQMLIAIATRMKQALREVDTLARLGGDEFVAVLLDLADIQSSEPMLTRLLAAAAQPLRVGDLILQVSASLGVTFYPQTEDLDADQLLRQADQAMYQAKLSGKNRYHVFDAEQDRSVRGHHESVERVRQALTERELVLYYQPKVNMRTGAIIGAEALIRWQHPERGLLPPEVFLPVIEDHPLSVEVGEWVIETALTQMELWQAAGLQIPVSVNVSALQLQQRDFVERLRQILAAHPDVKLGELELEVVETTALEDLARVSEIIQACREMGVRFALDDFGTGYSSLTYLKRLPITLLKIDQSFVHDMLDDPDDLAILQGVLGLARAFRREVIAEGVETMEHGTLLLQLGCELAQGFGIARPMPAHEMPGWAASWRPNSAWLDLRSVSHEDLPLLFASAEHRAWVRAIEEHLKDEREIPPPLAHHQCHLGTWSDAEGRERHGAQPAFKAMELLHRKVHVLAAKMCDLHSRGRNPDALAKLAELHGLRDSLLEQLKLLEKGIRQ